jgi:hypothetical protein
MQDRDKIMEEKNISWKQVEERIQKVFTIHTLNDFRYHPQQSSYLEVPLPQEYIDTDAIEGLNQLCKEYNIIMSVQSKRKLFKNKVTLFFWVNHSLEG